uniref:Secreted protein n=1 Tax=Castor canadensis TaxID=51338 RepID=A0A8C0ZN24_CASCN
MVALPHGLPVEAKTVVSSFTNPKHLLFLLLSLFLQVSQDFPFLHPSETCVLNRLCRLGTDHMRFTEFIDQYTGHVQQQVGPGLEMCASRALPGFR